MFCDPWDPRNLFTRRIILRALSDKEPKQSRKALKFRRRGRRHQMPWGNMKRIGKMAEFLERNVRCFVNKVCGLRKLKENVIQVC